MYLESRSGRRGVSRPVSLVDRGWRAKLTNLGLRPCTTRGEESNGSLSLSWLRRTATLPRHSHKHLWMETTHRPAHFSEPHSRISQEHRTPLATTEHLRSYFRVSRAFEKLSTNGLLFQSARAFSPLSSPREKVSFPSRPPSQLRTRHWIYIGVKYF